MKDSNRLAGLNACLKDMTVEEVRRIDEVEEVRQFHESTSRKNPRRKPNSRTYQVHAKALSKVGEAIATPAESLKLTQGRLFDRMWEKYDAR